MGRKLPAQFMPADDEMDVFEVINQSETGEKTVQQKRLEDVLGELNDDTDDSEIKVYKQSDLGGKSSMSYIASFPVDKYSVSELQEFLRQNYGGGDYRIHVRQGGKVRANKLLSIESPKVAPVPGVSPIGEASNILATVLERMEKQNQMILQLVQGNQQPQQSRMDMLNEMLLFKQLFDNGNSGGNAFQQMRDMMGFLSEMGVTINGQAQEKDEPGFADLLDKFSPVIAAAMSQPQQTARKPDPMFAQKMMLKSGLAQLMRAAAKNSARETYAEMLLDQLDENVVREFITDPGAFEKVIKIEPKAAHYRAWFLDLAEHVKAALGMQSQYADLYDDGDDAINAGNDNEPAPDDGTDHL